MAGVLANAHPVDYYYREVEVCKNCYQCYTAMDRRREKGNRRQYKDKGGMRTVFAKRIERHKQRLEKKKIQAMTYGAVSSMTKSRRTVTPFHL